MAIEVITFGCRLNQSESIAIKQQAQAAGLSNTFIFNSCAVTSESERQLRQSIRKIRRSNPDHTIIVTGCAAQISPEKYADMKEVNVVIGNSEKILQSTYINLINSDSEKIKVNDIMSVKENHQYFADSFNTRARAFLQIQNGCNHRCTFCIIPYGRGNSRSVPLGEIIDNTQILVAQGLKEIVLTGVDITDYGLDLPGQPTFTNMIKRMITNVPGLKRLRFSSIDVAELGDDFIELFASNKVIMPYLHLSLQSGDDMILKRMKRRHTREQVINFCNKIRKVRPDVQFGADIIAGFPTETNEMFLNTLDLIKELQIGNLHVFPYSAREGTPAAKMPQIDIAIRKERAAILRQIGEEILLKSNSKKIGQVVSVLIEKYGVGKTEDFSTVKVLNIDHAIEGQVIECTIIGCKDIELIARYIV